MTEQPGYREQLYQSYASLMDPAGGAAPGKGDAAAARVFSYHFREWLPVDRAAPILDVACGAGAFLNALQHLGYTHASGVDRSPEQVSIAKNAGSHAVEGNLFNLLGERHAEFALITGLDIIEHLSKDEALAFLDLCLRALRPGGRFILRTPNGASPWGGMVRYGDFTHEICFTPDLLVKLLTHVGFTSCTARECEPIPTGYSAKSSVRYVGWLGIRTVLKLWNVIETGSPAGGIYTRVFAATGLKPQ